MRKKIQNGTCSACHAGLTSTKFKLLYSDREFCANSSTFFTVKIIIDNLVANEILHESGIKNVFFIQEMITLKTCSDRSFTKPDVQYLQNT